MKTNEYELGLLVEAIELSLTKVKRKRGECDRIELKPPIRNKTPRGFESKTSINIATRKIKLE